ncbi:alanine--tRNA ligase [Candidatus Liberibacter brunswickensis]|uniref:alanine--tRNA ligase n=1 Tax=Candidatus Liberibacter brunswickensis TaxID=1968796 RepID=UPI002FE15B75
MSDLKNIRTTFIDFFKKNGHKVLPSSSLVPKNDPTLMFTNSGMVQFKNIFTGQEKPVDKTVTTVQKCVRAGGKHNDLDNVGRTTRHHTFFEMLGNFAFGDYFKEKAIQLAWDLLTKEFDIDRRLLYVTVYDEDEDAFKLWKKISGLSSDKIIRITTNDNFWSMADIGPCGPCSEIFFDQGENITGGLPGSSEEGERYIEIWNLVFMQFEQKNNKERSILPNMSVDTGMGLERMSSILQGKIDNYDIDLFKNIIKASEQVTGIKYEGNNIFHHRVIADHLRSSSFLIADGVLPTNEGRGYVLRRIMRRAMCHSRLLGYKDESLMTHLFPVLCMEMGEAYPELMQAKLLIEETFRLEDIRFRNTLDKGLVLLDEASSNLGKNDVLDGEIAFKLYDTHGLPVDIIQDILWTRGFGGVDIVSFNEFLEKQRSKARAHSLGLEKNTTGKIWYYLKEKFGSTQFVGYDLLYGSRVVVDENDKIIECSSSPKTPIDITKGFSSKVKAIVQKDEIVEKAIEGQEVEVIFEKTLFYAESGGQVSDTGIAIGDGVSLKITDVQKKANGLISHSARVESGILRTDMPIVLTINYENRRQLSINHTATHLLHHALCTVIGSHINQSGSCVTHEGLRFDITHSKPITNEEIRAIEDNVNDVIAQDLPVITRNVDKNHEIVSDATALVGKQYGDKVRVVSVEYGDGKVHSSALCGGTHVRSTGEIMLFYIIRASMRRIEVITGKRARSHLVAQDEKIKHLSSFLKVPQDKVVRRVEEIWEERRKLKMQVVNAKKKSQINIDDLSCHKVDNVNFMSSVIPGMNSRDLSGLIDTLQKKIKSGIIMLIGISKEKKASVAVAVTKDLIDRFNAIDMARLSSNILGGKGGGGGRPNIAQSGGPDGDKADKAIEGVIASLKK